MKQVVRVPAERIDAVVSEPAMLLKVRLVVLTLTVHLGCCGSASVAMVQGCLDIGMGH